MVIGKFGWWGKKLDGMREQGGGRRGGQRGRGGADNENGPTSHRRAAARKGGFGRGAGEKFARGQVVGWGESNKG